MTPIDPPPCSECGAPMLYHGIVEIEGNTDYVLHLYICSKRCHEEFAVCLEYRTGDKFWYDRGELQIPLASEESISTHEDSSSCDFRYLLKGVISRLVKTLRGPTREFKKVGTVLKIKLPPDNVMVASLCIKTANEYQTKGDLDKALKVYETALMICERLGRKDGIAVSLIGIGDIYRKKLNLDKALNYYQQSIKISEFLGNKGCMASDYSRIGDININKGNFDKALECYSSALESYKSLGLEMDNYSSIGLPLEGYSTAFESYKRLGLEVEIANSYNNIGLTYAKKGDFDKALEYHGQALKIFETLGENKGIATTYCNFGHVYYGKGDFNKALEYFNKTLKIEKNIGRKEGIAIACSNIGSIYVIMGMATHTPLWPELDKAIENYETALALAYDGVFLEDIRNILSYTIGIYNMQNKPEKAEEWRLKFKEKYPQLDI